MKLDEITPARPVKPKTPEQMRASTDKRAEANARVQDERKTAAIKIAAAKRKAAEL